MKFNDGVVIGIAAGIVATFFFGLLTEFVVLVILAGIAVWRFRWIAKGRNTPSTEKKSPSSYL